MTTTRAAAPTPQPQTAHSPADPAPKPDVPPAAPNASGVTNRQLVLWMFGFLRPVKGLVFLACLYLTLWVGAEVLTARQAGEVANTIKSIQVGGASTDHGFVAWFVGNDPAPSRLRGQLLVLVGLVVAYGVLRYLREVANAKMSMTMVYYIREAVYDKLQRVGFGFHDALSSGQLINRALSDLQNVRQFVQTAVLVTLEIALVVVGNILLLLTRHPWVAVLALVPLSVWTFYILRFSKKVQPAAKAVMEAEDRNVSLITENIAGVHVVKAFATEKFEIDKYCRNCDTFMDRVLTRIRLFANFQPVVRTIAMASLLSLFLLAAVLMLYRKMDAGDLLILGAAMTAILNRLEQIGTINEQYQNAVVSSRRLHEVLMARHTVPEPPDMGANAVPKASRKLRSVAPRLFTLMVMLVTPAAR